MFAQESVPWLKGRKRTLGSRALKRKEWWTENSCANRSFAHSKQKQRHFLLHVYPAPNAARGVCSCTLLALSRVPKKCNYSGTPRGVCPLRYARATCSSLVHATFGKRKFRSMDLEQHGLVEFVAYIGVCACGVCFLVVHTGNATVLYCFFNPRRIQAPPAEEKGNRSAAAPRPAPRINL